MASAVSWSLTEAASLAEANEELLETWSSSLKKTYGEFGNTQKKSCDFYLVSNASLACLASCAAESKNFCSLPRLSEHFFSTSDEC